jgi:hypothetical protein
MGESGELFSRETGREWKGKGRVLWKEKKGQGGELSKVNDAGRRELFRSNKKQGQMMNYFKRIMKRTGWGIMVE